MNIKRMRGRGHHQAPRQHQQHRNVPMNRNHVFDSNGPDVRLRGTSQQLFEKYLQLGRDATSAGDRVMAESYFQHAEHYFRILNAMQQAQAPQGQPHQGGQNGGNPNGNQNGQRRGYEGEGIDPVDAAVEQAMNGHGGEPALAGEGEQPKIQPSAE